MSMHDASRYARMRRRTYEILDGAVVDRASHTCEIFIALLVVANVVAIILESVQSIHDVYEVYFHYFDLVSVMVFSLEYVLRVWSYRDKYHGPNDSPWRGRKEYMFSAFGLVDFFSIFLLQFSQHPLALLQCTIDLVDLSFQFLAFSYQVLHSQLN